MYLFSDELNLLQSDGFEIKRIYDLDKDKSLKNNIYKNNPEEWIELNEQFKLRLQQYNNRMINNKLHYKK